MLPCFVFWHVLLAECLVAVFTFHIEGGLCSAFGALDHYPLAPEPRMAPVPFKRVLGLAAASVRCPIPVLTA